MTASAPLVADGPDRAADGLALVAGLETASGGRPWRWPLLPTEEGAVPEMLAAMRARGWTIGTVAAFERPVMDRRADHDAFLAGHPNRSRFKDLRRRARRLAEAGTVAYAERHAAARTCSASSRPSSTWSAPAGRDRPAPPWPAGPRPPRSPMRLFADAPGPVGVRADALTLDGRPVAISLALVGGGTATLLKTAYDEDLRSHAPGLLLEAEIVRACHETGFADRLDSATLDGSALESLYRDRTAVAEIIAVPPGRHALSLERRLAARPVRAAGARPPPSGRCGGAEAPPHVAAAQRPRGRGRRPRPDRRPRGRSGRGTRGRRSRRGVGGVPGWAKLVSGR